MFDWYKPTSMMSGQWLSWTDENSKTFKKAHNNTGQVAIMVNWMPKESRDDEDVPNLGTIWETITKNLSKKGYTLGEDYIIMDTPNIVDVTFENVIGNISQK